MRADDAWRSMVTRTPARFIEAASFLNRMMQVTSSLFDFNGCAANPSMRGIHTLKSALKIQFSSFSPQSGGLGGQCNKQWLNSIASSFFEIGTYVGCMRGNLSQVLPAISTSIQTEEELLGQSGLKKTETANESQKNPGQKSLWEERTFNAEEIQAVAKKFVMANYFNPQFAMLQFPTPQQE